MRIASSYDETGSICAEWMDRCPWFPSSLRDWANELTQCEAVCGGIPPSRLTLARPEVIVLLRLPSDPWAVLRPNLTVFRGKTVDARAVDHSHGSGSLRLSHIPSGDPDREIIRVPKPEVARHQRGGEAVVAPATTGDPRDV